MNTQALMNFCQTKIATLNSVNKKTENEQVMHYLYSGTLTQLEQGFSGQEVLDMLEESTKFRILRPSSNNPINKKMELLNTFIKEIKDNNPVT